MKIRNLFLIGVVSLFWVACDDDKDGNSKANPLLVISDTFQNSLQGWEGDFADYPSRPEDSTFYELQFNHVFLPAPLDETKKAILISGNNHSDDLFMFIKKKITGLEPNQLYDATFEIEFASNAPTGHIGTGGSPGESVYMGVGLITEEPLKMNDGEGYYRMNIRKINQSDDGEDMKVIGNIANGTDEYVYKLIQRSRTFSATSDNNGELWAIIGTDSGFESTTTLYYNRVKITFTSVK